MSQGGRSMPYSGHASLNNAASQNFPLTGHQEEQERDAATRPTELTRMQTAAREAEEEELRKTGRNEVQQGGTASQVKAGAEYLEKELHDIEQSKAKEVSEGDD